MTDTGGTAHDVSYTEAGGVVTIMIERPQVHNAFREQTVLELVEAFDRADAAADVGVVVLTGAGEKAFSTGGDVGWEKAFDPAAGRHTARLLMRLAEAVRGTGKPVIAKVRGWCVGGGNELAMLCDLVVAAQSARFAHTDSLLGNSPIWYATQLLPRLVGARRTREILMLGEHWTAAEAAAIGWINRAVPDEELDGVVDDWCARLLARSPQALRLTKVSLEGDADHATHSVRQGFAALTAFYDTAEFQEGTSAFLERRPPRFRP